MRWIEMFWASNYIESLMELIKVNTESWYRKLKRGSIRITLESLFGELNTARSIPQVSSYMKYNLD